MKNRLLPTLLLGLIAALPVSRADAGIDVDFRLELQWRASYQHEFDAAVVLYEYSHFRGRRLVLYPGERLDDFYDYEWGFRVRSVEVIGPVHIVLFDESGLWGHELKLHTSAEDLGDYRMRLNAYSTFRWHRRARSAYVSFNPRDYDVSIEIGPRLLPRIYCARPIIPVYFDTWVHYSWHYPRPRWDNNRWRHRAPVPPPNVKPYRPGGRPPVVAPPPPPRTISRPTAPPPSTGRPSVTPPPNRPGTPPPGHPSSGWQRPEGKPHSPPASPPSTRPTQDRPSAPPATRPGRTTRPSPPSSRPPSTPPSPPPSRVETSPPPSAAPPSSPPPRPTSYSRPSVRSSPPSRAPSPSRPSRPPSNPPPRPR